MDDKIDSALKDALYAMRDAMSEEVTQTLRMTFYHFADCIDDAKTAKQKYAVLAEIPRFAMGIRELCNVYWDEATNAIEEDEKS